MKKVGDIILREYPSAVIISGFPIGTRLECNEVLGTARPGNRGYTLSAYASHVIDRDGPRWTKPEDTP